MIKEKKKKVYKLKGLAYIVTVEMTDIPQEVQKRQMRVENPLQGTLGLMISHSARGAYTLAPSHSDS